MIHHRCLDCQFGFIAISYEEVAEGDEEEEELDGQYAKYCPYCGSEAVEAV